MFRKPAGAVAALFVVSALLVAQRGAAQSRDQWPTYAIADAPPAMSASVQRGDLLIISLQSALLSELRRELTSGGTVAALKACHLDATAETFRIARTEGIAVGRTSARLRNPTNAPKPWAAAIIARHAAGPARGIDGYVVDLGDRIGLLRPIVEQATCAPCHGAEAKLDDRVRAELRERYPSDKAVNFRDGDLRGWFWVEIPKGSQERPQNP
jgi:hypothetical protein